MKRLGTEDDIDRVLELFNSSVNLTGNIYEYNKNDILEYITHDTYRLFVFEEDNKIVGVISISFGKISKWAQVEEIFVDKNYRRKGIATKLMAYVENMFKGRNVSLIVDEKNKEMQELMNKKDYKKGRKYYFYTK